MKVGNGEEVNLEMDACAEYTEITHFYPITLWIGGESYNGYFKVTTCSGPRMIAGELRHGSTEVYNLELDDCDRILPLSIFSMKYKEQKHEVPLKWCP